LDRKKIVVDDKNPIPIEVVVVVVVGATRVVGAVDPLEDQ